MGRAINSSLNKNLKEVARLNTLAPKASSNWSTPDYDTTRVNGFGVKSDGNSGDYIDLAYSGVLPGTWQAQFLVHAAAQTGVDLKNNGVKVTDFASGTFTDINNVVGNLGPLKGALVDTELSAVDHSGNGYDLTVTGATARGSISDEVMNRWGRGYDFDGASNNLFNNASTEVQENGDFAAVSVFEYDATTGNKATVFASTGTSDNDSFTHWGIYITSGGNLVAEHYDGTTRQSTTIQSALATGFHTLWLRRDVTSGDYVWSLDGVSGTAAYAGSAPNASGGSLHLGGSSVLSTRGLNGAIYQARFWDSSSIPSDGSLDAIVDPDDLTYRYTPEGTEVGCWFMERPTSTSTAFADHSGNSNDLTETGTVSMLFGPEQKYGAGVGGFTTSNYLSEASTAVADMEGDLTIAGTFKVGSSIASLERIISGDSSGTGGDQAYALSINSSGEIRYDHNDSTTTVFTATSSGLGIAAGDWIAYHLRRDNTAKTVTVSVSINGAAFVDAIDAESYSGQDVEPQTYDLLLIGVNQGSSSKDIPFGGTVHTLAIWDKLADQTEVDNWLDSTTTTNRRHAPDAPVAAYHFDYLDSLHDSAEHGFDLTEVSGPFTAAWSGTKGFSEGQTLDGAADYWTVPNDSDLAHTGDMAVMLRVDVNIPASIQSIFSLMDSTSSDSDFVNFEIYHTPTGGFTALFGEGGDNTQDDVSSATGLGAGEFTVIAIRDITNSQWILRVDGVEVTDSATVTPWTSNMAARIGSWAGTGASRANLDGTIHDVRVLNRVPTADEIADYEAGVIDNLNPFGDEVAAWGFGTPAAEMVRKEETSDYTGNGFKLTAQNGPLDRVISTTTEFGIGVDLDSSSYTDPSGQYISIANPTGLQTTGDAFFMCRVNLDTLPGGGGDFADYIFRIGNTSSGSDTVENMRVSVDSTGAVSLVHAGEAFTSSQVVTVETEETIIAWRDSNTLTLNLVVNGTHESASYSATPATGINHAYLGSNINTGTPERYMDGKFYDAIYAKRIPTEQERTDYLAGTLSATNAPSDALAAWGFEDHIEDKQTTKTVTDSDTDTFVSETFTISDSDGTLRLETSVASERIVGETVTLTRVSD